MALVNGLIAAAHRIGLRTARGQQLVGPAAAAWDALSDAVLAAYGWRPALTDSYRPLAVQERIFRERYRVQLLGRGKYGDVRWWKGLRWVRVTGAAAAVPGTSNHGGGSAVDVTALGGFYGQRYKQLASLAAQHGWDNREGRSIGEAWHWTYNGTGGAIADAITGPATSKPAPPPPASIIKELATMPMPVRVRKHDGGIALVNITNGTFRALDVPANALLARLDVPIPAGMNALDDVEWNLVRQLVRDLAKPMINA